MARLNREVVITEKLDGTNSQIVIAPVPAGFDPEHPENAGVWLRNGFTIRAGSKNRWIAPGKTSDNYGFAQWVLENAIELLKLGPGRHFGEWWGAGIQRNYGLKEKRFSLFNVHRWFASSDEGFPGIYTNSEETDKVAGPNCCHVVPTLYRGKFSTDTIGVVLDDLGVEGSVASPGFMQPEGIVVYHTAANFCFKVTLENDESPKSLLTR